MNLRKTSVLVLFLLGILAAGAYDTPFTQESIGDTITLPQPQAKGLLSLEEALWQRKSVRSFSDLELSWEQIGQLLWSAQGVNRSENRHRTCPSAGATYPLELYVVKPGGIYRYLPNEHAVVKTLSGDMHQLLAEANLGSKMMQVSQCVFLISAVFERTVKEYGKNGISYVYLEAGHAAQNLLLQAEALGLGGVPNGSVLDRQYQQMLGIPEREKLVYILVVGYPS
ncbi:MAG: SagB/ThcOx family dehydrogenase [Candidatus Omnitrophota bacterium]|jgi:SagB-type dehydrogenase family enzyme|nr:MAG: SagB/ThcOx family dehydrogenase [Candidatus Omnitrophota bacterium]